MPLWVALWLGLWSGAPAYYDPLTWHAHEMLYGYAGAVVAGFLLTSVRNWTGRPTPSGIPLAALAALWLAARAAPFIPMASPQPIVAALDLAFLPALMLAIGIPLVRHGKWQNTALLSIPALMLCGNAAVHFAMLNRDPVMARQGLDVGLYAVVLLIVILGGRVIPFFIRGAVAGAAPRAYPWLESSAIAAFVLTALASVAGAPASLLGILAGAAAVLHGMRLFAWHDRRLWDEPLLWVLFLAYAWLIVGLALTALAAFGIAAPSLAVHALTAGTISVMTLGMMARVALGHSGRPLRAAPLTVGTFYLINLAALCRVGGPWLMPQHSASFIALSGLLFTASALTFVWVYAPILISPRADGKPG